MGRLSIERVGMERREDREGRERERERERVLEKRKLLWLVATCPYTHRHLSTYMHRYVVHGYVVS